GVLGLGRLDPWRCGPGELDRVDAGPAVLAGSAAAALRGIAIVAAPRDGRDVHRFGEADADERIGVVGAAETVGRDPAAAVAVDAVVDLGDEVNAVPEFARPERDGARGSKAGVSWRAR